MTGTDGPGHLVDYLAGRRRVRSRGPQIPALSRGLADLERGAKEAGVRVLDVQLVAQVVRSTGYAAFKTGREKAWANTPYSTATWPKKLSDSEYAALLLPLSAGRVGVAVGKHPAVIALPIFGSGSPTTGGSYDDLVLGLVTNWVNNPAEGFSARLAPPVIEVVGRRGVLERRLERFGQQWSLPAPDGV